MKYFLIFGLSFILGLFIIFVTGHGNSLFMFFPLMIYLTLIGFVVWFGISFIKVQRERNDILTEILKKFERKKIILY